MYDLYPEWGPARHRHDDEAAQPSRRPRYWEDRPEALVSVGSDAVGTDDPDDN